MKVVKSAINNHPTEFVETGNTNIKRGFPEGTSPLWSVTGDRKLTLPQPQQYDDMGGEKSKETVLRLYQLYIANSTRIQLNNVGCSSNFTKRARINLFLQVHSVHFNHLSRP